MGEDTEKMALVEEHGSPDASGFGLWAPTLLQRAIIFLAHTTPLGRGSGRRLAARILGRLRPGPIDFYLGGAPFRFDIVDNSTDRQSLLRPAYNREEFDFLVGKMGEGAVFVDIGANVGFFSVKVAAHCGPDCSVVAIEPNPVTLARLRFNAQSLRDRIAVVGKAIGRVLGTARFHSSGSNLGESRFDAAGEIEVPVEPLLDVVTALGLSRIDALKIDVEGYEDEALMPFFETAPTSLWPKRLVLEYTAQSNWKQDCLAHLLANGYRQHSKTRGNVLLELGGRHDATAPGGILSEDAHHG